jgi:hypothetical protein
MEQAPLMGLKAVGAPDALDLTPATVAIDEVLAKVYGRTALLNELEPSRSGAL